MSNEEEKEIRLGFKVHHQGGPGGYSRQEGVGSSSRERGGVREKKEKR